ncbi:MAG: SH3 domain-containing protein [Alphaproteobacteria bacterium]
MKFTAAGLIACFWVLPGSVAAGDDSLPLPRFVSLKAAEVNLRTGPGTRYPIDWVYQRRALPVEIINEFGNWRRVRDSEGTMGWIHRALLSGRRTALVAPPERMFHRAPDADAPAVFRAAPGVLVNIISCDGAWCHVERGDAKAWTRQGGLWGVYPGELIE